MVGIYKGYDVYCSFVKWRISLNGIQRTEKFDSYLQAVKFIDKELEDKSQGIQQFVAHADSIKTTDMKKIFLTMVGHKQVEKGVIVSVMFYVHCGDFLLIVPFVYLKMGDVIKHGINLYNFMKQNKLRNIKEVFKKEMTIINGKITRNNLTIYNCRKIDWEKLLDHKATWNILAKRETCLLDN